MYLKQEKGYEKVVSELKSAKVSPSSLLVSEISIGEVCYIAIRNRLIKDINGFLQILFALPIVRIHPDFDMIIEAAHIKAKYPISYADAFVVAAAQRENAIILTGDPEFKKVEGMVEIEWLRK